MCVRKKSPRSVISRVSSGCPRRVRSRREPPRRRERPAAGAWRARRGPDGRRRACRVRGCAPTSRRSASTSQPRDTHQTSFLGAARSADDGHQQQCDEPVARRPHCHSGRRPRLCAPREALPAPGPHSTARCMLITHARIQTRIASARPSGRVQDGTSHAARVGVQYCTAQR